MPSSAVTLTDIETAVRAVSARALGLDDVDLDDNLLELGVDSLIATRIVADLRTQFLVDIPLIEVFENPEVRAFAEAIADLVEEARE